MIKQRDLLIIIFMTFLTVVAWVGFNIYHLSVTSTISDELQIQIAPINPNFDINIINKLKSREPVEPLYMISNSNGDITATEAAQVNTGPTLDVERISPTVSMSP